MTRKATVLVAYASKMGGTAGIAEAIGKELRSWGHQVDVREVSQVATIDGYDAVVLGSALYYRRWLRAAVRFLRTHRDELRERQVWLFHSGPIGPDKDTVQTTPPAIRRLAQRINAVPPVTLAGRLEPATAKGLVARWIARGQLAEDSRDWQAIERWARHIHESIDAVADTPWSRGGRLP